MDDVNPENAEKAVDALNIEEESMNDDSPVDQETQETTEPEKVDPAEEEARSQGWCPKEEWNGDPEDWVDAKEFVGRAPIFKANKRLKDEIRSYKKSVDELNSHNKKLAEYVKNAEESGRQKALEELREQREEAVLDGDLERFQEIDKEIQEHAKEPEQEEGIPKPILDWQEENDWFAKDEAMTSYMIHKQTEYRGKGLQVEDALAQATEDVKKEFAHKFDNPKRNSPSPTAGKSESKGSSLSVSDLPSEYRPIFQTISRKTGMKLSEYMDQLKDIGAI